MAAAQTTSFEQRAWASSELEIPPPPPSHPFRLRRVWRLLRALSNDPEQTERVFEVFDAVGGDGGERHFQRFVRDPEGRALLREQPRIEQRLADRESLAAMPEGSLGRAYLEFARRNGFAADSLAQANRDVEREQEVELDACRQWFWDRYSVCHDLWHVITGCDTTPDGEAVLLAFAHAQTPQRGYAALLATVVVWANLDLRFQLGLWRAWRAGRRAAPLLLARWEELLPRSLDLVRRELGVERIRS